MLIYDFLESASIVAAVYSIVLYKRGLEFGAIYFAILALFLNSFIVNLG